MIPATLPPGFGDGSPSPVRRFQAPGRVNLIGEHTDYNDGFVFPFAIDRNTVVTIAPVAGRAVRVWSTGFPEPIEFDLDSIGDPAKHWSDYVRGVVVELIGAGVPVSGAHLMIDSSVPLNAGLSSSAAIEVAVAMAFLGLAGAKLDPVRVAKLCQRAENRFVGAPCGIMDQYAACHGKRGHAILIDCRTLTSELVPLPKGHALVVCNSMVKHSVGGGEYGERRSSCEEAARRLGVPALRDVSEAEFAARAGELTEIVRKRARHVVTENARVIRAVDALKAGDTEALGKLMNESHESMRIDFEASCAEVDLLVDLARKAPGVAGARMTGGGFGGCTVNLVDQADVTSMREQVRLEYEKATGIQAEIYVFEAADAAGEIAV